MYSLLGTPTPQLPSCGTALATNTLSPGTRSKCEYGHTIKYKRGQYEQQVVWSV